MPPDPASLTPDALEELKRRLDHDRSSLAEAFWNGADPGRVTGVRPTGDPHAGGRRVAVVRFRSGARLVYKPRPVATEAWWHRLVSWINARAGEPLLLAPDVVARGSYGWTRWLPSQAPASAAARRRYHRRAGVLMAVLDLFEVRDAHIQNVIVSDDFPVLVDAETLAHPRLARFRASPSLALTGFLPAPGASWRAGIHAGRPAGAPPAGHDVAQVVAGYRIGYDLLQRHRQRLCSPRGPLAGLRQLRVRVVLRPTEAYTRALHGGGVWPIERGQEPGFPPAVRAAVWAHERAALAHGDVPVFHALAGGRLIEPGGPAFALSGAGMIARRLANLNRGDREEMVSLIRGALALDALTAVSGRRAGAGRPE